EAVIPLNDSLNLANKYVPEAGKTWRSYFDDLLYVPRGTQGLLGGLPLDRTATTVYANLSLLERAGIDLDAALDPATGAPADFVTLLDWIERLRAPERIPFSLGTSVLGGWLQTVLADQFFWGLTERFDVLNYHPAADDPGQAGQVSQEEIVMQIACSGWQPFSEPAVQGLYQFIHDLVPYLPVGYQTASIMSYSYDHFMQGKLALLWEGTWLAGELAADSALPFAWQAFWLPPVTDSSTPFARQPPIQPRDVGSIVNAVGLNAAVLKKGNLEQCLDWMMFLTTPENNARYVNEVPMLLPMVRGAAVLPLYAPLFKGRLAALADSQHTWSAPLYWLGGSYYADAFQRELAMYLNDEVPLETLVSESNAAVQDSLKEVIKGSAVQYNPLGSWDLTRWVCDPQV
ncbi:MAG: hypothetical protein ACYC6L_13360, partial [Anaerolineae bacterium]